MQEFARYTVYNGSFSYSYILLWELYSQNYGANYSTIKLQAIIQVNGANYISWSRGSASLHTNSFGLSTTYYKGNTVVHEMIVDIGHEQNGTKTVYIGGSIDTSYLMKGSCGGNITLPSIPRYANFLQHYVNNEQVTTTSVVVYWATDSARDWTDYSLNDSPWTPAQDVVAGDQKSGYYTIRNLLPNTRYRVRTRIKRGDSQLWTESNYLEFITSCKTVHIKVNGEMKNATPYIGKNGKWNIASPYIGKGGQWKRGK